MRRDHPPFYEATTKPELAWVTALDGVRLRVGAWAATTAPASLGTVLLLPGRTEYLEKYAPLVRHLTGRGFNVTALDWRGQGLSDRLHTDRDIGHVASFADYQLDLAALEAWTRARFAGPWAMIAHSMGGLIGLRGLMGPRPPYQVAIFSAPMWGIRLPMWRLPTAAVLTRMARPLAADLDYAPGQSGQSYVLSAEFEGNALTSDLLAYTQMQAALIAHPELALGGPSLGWVRTALREARAVGRLASPEVPTLTVLGTEEAVVTKRAIAARLARWPEGRLLWLEGARHDLWHEAPDLRARLYDMVDAHLERAFGG